MARKTVVEKLEDAAAELERGSAVSLDPMTNRDGWRCVVWSRDGRRELMVGVGRTRTDAAAETFRRLRAKQEGAS